MSVFFDIQAALNGRLNTMAGKPPIAWQNDGYDPVIGTLWARPTVLPADTAGATMGPSGTDEHIGVYVIDVFAPIEEGQGEALQMADTIADRFKPVTELTYNGRMVRCVTASIGAASTEENWYQIPVRIGYLSFTTKR